MKIEKFLTDDKIVSLNNGVNNYGMSTISDEELIKMSIRYLSTMSDTQVRSILYIMTQRFIDGSRGM